MEISGKLKERFSVKIVIFHLKLFKEPYFTDRLQLYGNYYNTLIMNTFTRELEKYKCEQDYLKNIIATKML